MFTLRSAITTLLTAVLLLPAPALRASEPQAGKSASGSDPEVQGTDQMKSELQQLKQAVAALEQRLAAQEKAARDKAAQKPAPAQAAAAPPPAAEPDEMKDLGRRVSVLELEQATDRVKITGDFRFEAHSIRADVPAHFDGMNLQNGIVKAMFAVNALGRMPASMSEINGAIAGHYSDYQQFTN